VRRGFMEIAGASVEEQRRHMDEIVKKLSDTDAQDLFSGLDLEAESHGPITRQLYLALYRRLHG
jgi:hypothetical protein